MNADPPTVGPNACSIRCGSTSSIEALNRECFCLGVDRHALHAELESIVSSHGFQEALVNSHPNLFSTLPFYLSRAHIEQAAKVVTAIEEVTASPVYRSAVLSWAPAIAAFDPGSPGGLLGLDFHLGLSGPRLIEINTNPGGVLLNALLGQAQRACMPDLMVPPTDATHVAQAVLEVLLTEWHLQRGPAPPELVAIVDESPRQQYLYPEFILFQELFRRHGCRAEICAPDALAHKYNHLWLDESPVDFVYNRLTDFSLQQFAHETLRSAYLEGSVALSPHPRAHALYADKRNLSLLGSREFLQDANISQASIDVLIAAIPPTQLVTSENREAMWADRRRLFFKPAAGYGSKASYRGDKLTRRVWDEMATGSYVAQQIVVPSVRHVASGAEPLKVDVRCYAYLGEALLYAARMYQGQTTNFRTPGGGFAPVLTSR